MAVDLTSVMILLALQVLAFSWRVAREVDGNERHPFPFVPVPDNVNVLAMLAVLYFCIVAPFTATGLRIYPVAVMAKASFAAACVLLIAHPLVVASHYRVWGGARRSADPDADAPLPYCTRQEAIVQVVALGAAAAAFLWVLQAANVPTVTLTPG
jgi:hypothetical protein